MVKGHLINDIEKCVSNWASSPDSKSYLESNNAISSPQRKMESPR